jgi:uncharacterized protein (TIGR03000 family)
MYSVVLMVALTAGGTEAPSRHHHGGCGCYGYSGCGCCGYSSCGCCGYSSCGSCGYSSCGCCGYSSCGSCGSYSGGCGCCGGYYGGPGMGGSGSGGSGSGKDDDGSKGTKGSKTSAPAKIVVSLPENAKLKVDDYQTTSTASTRTFETPALPGGRDFQYTLTVEVVRDGKTVTATKQITVRAGQTTEAKFELVATAAAE